MLLRETHPRDGMVVPPQQNDRFERELTLQYHPGRPAYHLGQGWEAMGNNGIGNFSAGHTTWGIAWKQWETMDLITFLGWAYHLGQGGEAMGNNGFGNFWAGHPLGRGLGSNWKQWIW